MAESVKLEVKIRFKGRNLCKGPLDLVQGELTVKAGTRLV